MVNELDEQCARALGWTSRGTPPFWYDEKGEALTIDYFGLIGAVPDFSMSSSFVYLLEDDIERRGVQTLNAYVSALWDECGCAEHNGEGPEIWKPEWLLIRATPEQRCRAYLKAREL